jgi:hypothetical protein
MTDFSTVFPPKLLSFLIVLSVGYMLCVLAPALYAALVVLRRRPVLPRRLLFVLVVASLCYGLLFLFSFALELPATAFAVYIAPQLQAAGYYSGQPFTIIAGFLAENWWFALGPTLLFLAVAITRYLARRWGGIVAALHAG